MAVVSVPVVPTLSRGGGGGVLGHVLKRSGSQFFTLSSLFDFFLGVKTNIADPPFWVKLASTVAKHL